MQKLTILNSREKKKLRERVVEIFGCFLVKEYVFLLNGKGRYFVVNRDFSELDLEHLRVERYGLYFAEDCGDLRLSKEGATLLYKEASEGVQNVVDLDSAQVEVYFQGEDLVLDLGIDSKWVILKHKDEVIGCAKYKEGRVLNFLAKIHRGTVIV